MECNRCAIQPLLHAFVQANLEESLGRMKTKQIIAAVNNLKVEFKGLCKCCHSLPSETNKLIEDLKTSWNEKFTEICKSIKKDHDDLLPQVEKLRNAFIAVCYTCSKVSDDDNPSHHGQVFVSLDSGNCQADSGRAKSTHTDDNIVLSRADWLNNHRSPDAIESTYGTDPRINVEMAEEKGVYEAINSQPVSKLPLEIEDTLRKEFAKFVQLDILDKILVACVMSGMNIAEFAKMLWLPYSIVDPKTKTIRPITKQAAHARWKGIVARFPVFASIASGSETNKRAMARLAAQFADPNGDKDDDRFRNGKMTSSAIRAEEKAREKEEKRAARKKKAEEAKRRKALKKNRKRNSYAAGEFLPGFADMFQKVS